MLATTSLGAIWTSTSPDFGEASVVERFGQTRPRVLFAVDGYRYGGKAIDIQDKVASVVGQLDSIEQTVLILCSATRCSLVTTGSNCWQASMMPSSPSSPWPSTTRSISLYSSGTTGKTQVHRARHMAAPLLQHLKEHQLHCDIKPGSASSTSPPVAG